MLVRGRRVEAALSQCRFDKFDNFGPRDTPPLDDRQDHLKMANSYSRQRSMRLYRWAWISAPELILRTLLYSALRGLVVLAASAVGFFPFEIIATAKRAKEVPAAAVRAAGRKNDPAATTRCGR